MISPHTPPGTKIVCIDAEPHSRYAVGPVCDSDMDGLTENAVYTVDKIIPWALTSRGFVVCLGEIIRRPRGDYPISGFALDRFRRLELPSSLTEFVEFPKIARLSREIIITEKIDGTNGVIYIGEDGEILAGSRSQWIAMRTDGAADNFGFASWVEQHADDLRSLGPGRHYGEWWGSGIQRGYGLLKGEKRFSLFNVARWDKSFPDALLRPACCHVVPVLYRGPFLTDAIEAELKALKDGGSRASPGFMKPEGVVIFHPQGNIGFKKTIEKDDEWKGKV